MIIGVAQFIVVGWVFGVRKWMAEIEWMVGPPANIFDTVYRFVFNQFSDIVQSSFVKQIPDDVMGSDLANSDLGHSHLLHYRCRRKLTKIHVMFDHRL